MVEATLPTLGAVLITAAVDSINPCAIGVALLLVATLIKQDRKKDILKVGMIYITAVFLTYFVAGIGILFFLANLPVQIANYVTIAVALIVIFGGLLEIKDFYWYGKGTSLMIPEEYAEKIADKMNDLTTPAAVVMGIFVAAVELPCTGGPYLAILTVLSQQGVNMTAYLMMALYNLIFVMPLIIIVTFAYLGSYKVSEMKEWKHMNKAKMRMAAGLLMIVL
ncbi:MAG: cytochrome c biogenesis CcdA family protein, partial [Candidatus Nanohalobium sp.]